MVELQGETYKSLINILTHFSQYLISKLFRIPKKDKNIQT